MPPYSNGSVTIATGVLFEHDSEPLVTEDIKKAATDKKPRELVWRNIILFSYLHLAALYGAFLFLTSAKWQTDLFGKLYILYNT